MRANVICLNLNVLGKTCVKLIILKNSSRFFLKNDVVYYDENGNDVTVTDKTEIWKTILNSREKFAFVIQVIDQIYTKGKKIQIKNDTISLPINDTGSLKLKAFSITAKKDELLHFTFLYDTKVLPHELNQPKKSLIATDYNKAPQTFMKKD